MQNSEEQPLIENKERSIKVITKSSRKVTVEPVVALTAVGTLPLIQLSQEFIYQRIFNQLADEHGVNVSADPTDKQSDCLQTNSSSLNTTDYDLTQSAQASAATFSILVSVIHTAPACISTTMITAFSDKMGRRYSIIPSVVGMAFYGLSHLLTSLFELPLWCLLIGCFVDGLCGDYLTLLAGCNAYISDITTVKDRSYRITLLNSATFLLMIPSPLLFGFLARAVGFVLPFLCIFVIQVIGLLYAIFLVPETLASTRGAKFFTLSHLKDTLHVFLVKREPKGRRGYLCLLVLVGTIGSSLISAVLLLYTLFQLNRPLCWGADLIGIFLAVYMVVGGVGQNLGIRALRRCLSEMVVCLFSTCCLVLQNVFVGFVKTTVMMFLSTLLCPLSIMMVPLTRSMMSGLVTPDEQGKLFGALAFTDRLITIVASVFMNLIYTKTLGISSGFVFFVVAGLAAIGAIILLIMVIVSKAKLPHGQILSSGESEKKMPDQTVAETDN